MPVCVRRILPPDGQVERAVFKFTTPKSRL
jgi:hypothetical protein